MGSFIKIIRIFTSLYLTLTAHLAQIWCIVLLVIQSPLLITLTLTYQRM